MFNTTMNRPLVSIIMPTFNHERYILKSLESIINQNIDFEIEILIGDDCSTDNTRKECLYFKNKYPELVRLFFNPVNIGLLKNYKNLIENAKGKYLAILESDDYWQNRNKLKTQIRFLEENSDYGLIYTNANFLYENNKKLKESVQKRNPSGDIFKKLLKGNFIIACTTCFRKCLFDKYINIDDYIKENFETFDFPVWLELSLKTKFKFYNESTATYRIVSKSISNNSNKDKVIKFIDSSLNIVNYVLKKNSIDLSNNKYIKNSCKIQQVKYLCRQGAMSEAVKIAKNIEYIDIQNILKRLLLSNKFCLQILNKIYFK